MLSMQQKPRACPDSSPWLSAGSSAQCRPQRTSSAQLGFMDNRVGPERAGSGVSDSRDSQGPAASEGPGKVDPTREESLRSPLDGFPSLTSAATSTGSALNLPAGGMAMPPLVSNSKSVGSSLVAAPSAGVRQLAAMTADPEDQGVPEAAAGRSRTKTWTERNVRAGRRVRLPAAGEGGKNGEGAGASVEKAEDLLGAYVFPEPALAHPGSTAAGRKQAERSLAEALEEMAARFDEEEARAAAAAGAGAAKAETFSLSAARAKWLSRAAQRPNVSKEACLAPAVCGSSSDNAHDGDLTTKSHCAPSPPRATVKTGAQPDALKRLLRTSLDEERPALGAVAGGLRSSGSLPSGHGSPQASMSPSTLRRAVFANMDVTRSTATSSPLRIPGGQEDQEGPSSPPKAQDQNPGGPNQESALPSSNPDLSAHLLALRSCRGAQDASEILSCSASSRSRNSDCNNGHGAGNPHGRAQQSSLLGRVPIEAAGEQVSAQERVSRWVEALPVTEFGPGLMDQVAKASSAAAAVAGGSTTFSPSPLSNKKSPEAEKRQERRRRHRSSKDTARRDPARLSFETLRCRRREGQLGTGLGSLLSWDSQDSELLHSIGVAAAAENSSEQVPH